MCGCHTEKIIWLCCVKLIFFFIQFSLQYDPSATLIYKCTHNYLLARLRSTVSRAPSQRSWGRYPVWPHTFVSPSADPRGAVVSYWRQYVHEVLVNPLGGLSLPRKSVVRLNDHPVMTLDVYPGCKTTRK